MRTDGRYKRAENKIFCFKNLQSFSLFCVSYNATSGCIYRLLFILCVYYSGMQQTAESVNRRQHVIKGIGDC